MTTHYLKQCRPAKEETEYFWKLFHSAARVENRWCSELPEISDELSYCPNLTREQKLFLLRAWQVLVDDKGGFGRFMGAFDTYVHNIQDPDDDCVAYKPELKQLIEDGIIFNVVLEAYQEARQFAETQGRHACGLFDEVTALRQRVTELEARTVVLPMAYDINVAGERINHKLGDHFDSDEVIGAITAASIRVIEGQAE